MGGEEEEDETKKKNVVKIQTFLDIMTSLCEPICLVQNKCRRLAGSGG